MPHKLDNSNPNKRLDHLTGVDMLGKDTHTDIVSVKKSRLQSFLDSGYEVIEDGDNTAIIGKRK